ncbi:tape measure protein [Escherichia coli]|uniref:phage tail tape measure protein n=2 Tax=Escherichia coli TaxID=562 RepID=UPI000DA5E3DB|nr:phage tail tape measure protein [Escherichia coli]EAC1429620.1 phage tail tape measure protein [Escherichia coli]EEV8734625.1 phage tail tape measure protein [Escherichia coli]EEW2509130.1 phage tail tape measure protein [Escherichia coli]EEX2905356.1 phage tail tape measure protein [Escherichia coli]EFA9317575.1 tape measure protein [Escherichia coli]
MATLRELIIKISANSRSFQSEISRASRMGQDYYRTMQNGGRQSAAASRETRRALAEVTDQINTAKSSALNMAGAFAGAFASGHLISLADEWNSVNARLKQATQSSDDFHASQRELMAISQRTGTAFSDNASLFARSAASMREYGYSSEEVLKVTEAISTGLKLSGASTAEASSVITQFSQALAQGVLRGEEFNAVNESGDRVIRALAAGMGVARKDLKAMADDGKLTADKVVPALISQLGALRDEYSAMPDTVSSSVTKVENAFMAWVGGANEASGVTKTLSGVLNGVAGNIDTVATAAGALVAVGVARYFGNMASSAGSATAGLITAARNEVALAEAQLRGAQIATARARAAVYRAQQALAAARGTERQAAAEAKLAAAQASLTRNIAARTAAQTTLNTVTSVGSCLLSGALGLVGGVPGLVMLGAAAWYTMYQNQEQARESARQYAATIDEIRQKTSAMSLPEASDNEEKTRQALEEQNRLISEQEVKIRGLKNQIADYQRWLDESSQSGSGAEIILKGLAEATNQLAVEQSRLTQMQGKAQSIQDVLAGLEERRVALIRQQAAEQNKVYQSLLVMNGQHTEFNRLLGLGNELLQQRQGLVNVPLRLPQAPLDDKQQGALNNSERELTLSRLKGEARERARLGYAADDLGFVGDAYQTARQTYINNALEAWRNNQANKPKVRGGKSEAEKTEDVYNRLISQQKEQIALSGQNAELAKIKYRISQGDLSAISQIRKETLLRNAAILDQQSATEKLKALNEELLTPEEALLSKTKERLRLLKEASPASAEYREVMKKISRAAVENAPEYSGVSPETGGAASELFRVADAEKALKKWHKQQLDMQKQLLDEKLINEQIYADRVAEINQKNSEKLQDIQNGYTTASLSMFSDLTGQSAELLKGLGQEGSAAYKALFVASKAAAVAQAIINTELAATKAMAEGGMILGIPAATAMRAVGYASVALIAGQTLAGMAHDGIDRVPETGTWLLQKGERVVTASTSAKLDATLEKVQQVQRERQVVSGGSIHIQNSFTGKPDDATLAAIDSRNRQLVVAIRKEMAAQVISPTNEFGRALKGYYGRTRKE